MKEIESEIPTPLPLTYNGTSLGDICINLLGWVEFFLVTGAKMKQDEVQKDTVAEGLACCLCFLPNTAHSVM